MPFIKLDADVFIEVDDRKYKRTISKSDMINELNSANQQINNLPNLPSDSVLLAWAKQNYFDPSIRNRDLLQKRIDEINQILEGVKDENSIPLSKAIN